MIKQDEQKLVEGFRLILEGLGLDPSNSPHLKNTPERAARAWYHELCAGLTSEVPKITTFPSKIKQMVVLRDVPIRSLCAHHLLPFYGHAVIAYIPGNHKLLGLSKLSRIANYWARRPQVQEELTDQIADYLAKLVMPKDGSAGGVGVIIQARHLCMEFRGVNHAGMMVTSALRGIFHTMIDVREEFLRLSDN